MAMDKPVYYYRIFDEKEERKFFKCALERKEIEEELKEFEKTHDKFYTEEFVEFLKKKCPEAEMFSLTTIYY